MSVVVSDSSPLICLCFLRQQHILSQMFGEVIVPQAVAAEILRPHPPLGGIVAENIPGVRVMMAPELTVLGQVEGLQRGELEALALAIRLHADLVIMDETLGRRAAQAFGLQLIGTLGILARAKAQGLVQAVRPLMDALRNELGFFVSQSVYDRIVEISGE